MGSAISSAARTSSRTALKETQGKLGTPRINPNPPTLKSSPTTNPRVTARLQNNQPPQYHRKTTEEWSQTLKKISGAITSSTWQGEVKPHIQNQVDKERHSAQRSDGANQRLPGHWQPSEDVTQTNEFGVVTKLEGRITQIEILQLFNLRREDPQRWDAEAIAKKYGLDVEDVKNLLSFSRTYTARMDSDGHVRGYYNSDPENTISRFERD